MKIKYVGLKDRETAFGNETGGIVWEPGSSHEIDAKVATRMLVHGDVFALDEDEQTATGPSLGDKKPTDPIPFTKPDGTEMDLSAMDKAALHDLAKEIGVEVHPNSGPAKVIEAIQAKTE